MHRALSTVTMDDPTLFTDFVRNTLWFTNQQKIDLIANFVETFWILLALNDRDIEKFVKDTHSVNISRAAAQRILISNNCYSRNQIYVFLS